MGFSIILIIQGMMFIVLLYERPNIKIANKLHKDHKLELDEEMQNYKAVRERELSLDFLVYG